MKNLEILHPYIFPPIMDKLEVVQKKYKSGIGESMGKPDKKLKRILLIMGITGAVYGTFRFLLPLVIPFLLAWGVAILLRPSARWIAKRCRIRAGRRWLGIPAGCVAMLELAGILVLLGWAAYLGGAKLCVEMSMLLEAVPGWVRDLDVWLTTLCHRMEEGLCLTPNCMVYLMREMLRGLMDAGKKSAMPYLMANSAVLLGKGTELLIVSILFVVSVGLAVQEMDQWKARCSRSLFAREFQLIGRRLAIVANAYLRTQVIIMILTAVLCSVGFWLVGNPYYALAGMGTGILDALPVFGTGTVLFPWAAFCVIRGQWGRGLFLMALYVVCYFLRQILETRLMGDRVGLSPLETLITMYVGLKLFGIPGFLLGPVGVLLIRDLAQAVEEEWDGGKKGADACLQSPFS